MKTCHSEPRKSPKKSLKKIRQKVQKENKRRNENMDLNKDELELLQWLSDAEFSQYGECYGKALDTLVASGLAVIHGAETETNNPFIAKGRGIMFRAVSLTKSGISRAEEERERDANRQVQGSP